MQNRFKDNGWPLRWQGPSLFEAGDILIGNDSPGQNYGTGERQPTSVIFPGVQLIGNLVRIR
jgi:hypothetical protein